MLPIKKDYAAKLNELGAANWYTFIAVSFAWGNTPEGYEYWYNLAAAK